MNTYYGFICVIAAICLKYGNLNCYAQSDSIVSNNIEVFGDTNREKSEEECSDDFIVNDLGEIVVSVSTQSQDVTKESYLVTKKMREDCETAINMLGNVPGIYVNPVTETLKIDSENDVLILVNGNDLGDSYARSINPKRVRKVEILRYPAGRYAKYPIVLNLVLSGDYIGWDFGMRPGGAVSTKTPGCNNENIGVNFAFTRPKFSIYSDVNMIRFSAKDQITSETNYFDKFSEKVFVSSASSPNLSKNGGDLRYTLGTDYRPTENHLINIIAQGYLSRIDGISDFEIERIEQGRYMTIHEQSKDDRNRNQEHAIGLNYNGTIGSFMIMGGGYFDYYYSKDNNSLSFDGSLLYTTRVK